MNTANGLSKKMLHSTKMLTLYIIKIRAVEKSLKPKPVIHPGSALTINPVILCSSFIKYELVKNLLSRPVSNHPGSALTVKFVYL